MRTLLLFLILLSGPAYAQSPDNSPLTPNEGRQVLGQLLELQSCREESGAYREFVERDKEQDTREKANFEKALELEKRATALAGQERDLEHTKAETYRQMFEAVTKKRGGFGRAMCKIFSLGIARCN